MVYADLRQDKVPNEGILTGMALGFICAAWQGGIQSTGQAVLSAVFTLALLYPLFLIGGLGAGDIKVFLVTATFFPIKTQLTVMAAAFVAGGILGIGKVLSDRKRGDAERNRIHFTVGILVSVAWKLGGMY